MSYTCPGCKTVLKHIKCMGTHVQYNDGSCTFDMRFDGRCRKLKTGCIIWTGRIDDWGYGQVGYEGQCTQAHRVQWMRKNGPIPDGLIVLHKCHTPACVNIEHLRLGTNKENTADMLKAGRAGWWEGPRVKLTEEQVREIRRDYKLYNPRKSNAAELAAKYGILTNTVHVIVAGRSWKHVQ